MDRTAITQIEVTATQIQRVVTVREGEEDDIRKEKRKEEGEGEVKKM